MTSHLIYKSDIGKAAILGFYEKYLESFKCDFERMYVETTFGRTHVLVAGPEDGKPIFIFQGGNCINPMTLSWFKPLLENYRIYAPDTIGHPGFSAETRISARDDSFARWISELMANFHIEKSAFIGPSYGAGIILRLATFMPEKIACSVLVSPSGIQLGSKLAMIRKILVPLMIYKFNDSNEQMNKIANTMSDDSMKEMDQEIIASIFKYVKLEQEMPKLTEKRELLNYTAPTMIIAGRKDIFFPEEKIMKAAHEIIPNLTNYEAFDMGHFPSEADLVKMDPAIKQFLELYY
ncbi:alpha/beta hydrolase [Neobacillus bataviensis LMG 21833]|uniref:Alpha/beta hydrolase n=1 Tax=Neobacillus bataviensis LMG 21833 TaxID=1117379 RepID=K6DG63_9BACI|nr:alpha/beta hydrolase [Neobacillus bataviensis]EKN71552.1 alpha/beta hydrolase [Neobacillus bataviensis LMG 21833]